MAERIRAEQAALEARGSADGKRKTTTALFADLKGSTALEVAYGTVLQERRKALHERTAQAIEALYRATLDDHYSELAHHYARSGKTEKAVEYLHLAGQQAVQRSANVEAITHLTTALELLNTLPDTRERAHQELSPVPSRVGTAHQKVRIAEAGTVGGGHPTGEAEAYFLKAIEIARRQQAKSLELRAAMSLSRLWQQQGKQHEAHHMLAEIYGWFTEGFDTKDLQEAKALLEALSQES